MGIREIRARQSKYVDPDLDQEIAIEVENATLRRDKAIAKLALLWQERLFLFRSAAFGLALSTILVLILPVRFTSTTRLMPPDQPGGGVATILASFGKGDLGGMGSQIFGLKTSSDLFVGVLRSRTVQDLLINKFDLRSVYGHSRWEDTRKELDDRTDIAADRKSGIITIKVSDRSPQRSAALAREYVSALDHIVLALNTSAAHKERVFLENRLGQVQQDLEQAEKDFGDFASKNTTIDVKEQGKAMIGAAAEIEGQLIADRTELEGLRQIYTSGNARVRALQARINETQRQLQKLGGKPETADAAVSPETADLYPSIRKLPILGITYADLFRRAKVQETIFETLTKQYELAKVEEARETPSVKVLDEGEVPERKSFPPRILLVLLGLFVFVGGGALWILLHANWQRIEPQDPGKVLAQEVVGTIQTSARETTRMVLRKLKRGTESNPPDQSS